MLGSFRRCEVGGGGASGVVCASDVSAWGTTAMTSPSSVTIGRVGITAVPSSAWNDRGAPATSESFTFFQSSPDRFCTLPQACRSACPSLCTTSRYDGRHTGADAMYPTSRSWAFPSSPRTTFLRPRFSSSVLGGFLTSLSSSLTTSSFTSSGNAADFTELPPCSMTASVARKSPTSDSFILKRTSFPSTCPPRSK